MVCSLRTSSPRGRVSNGNERAANARPRLVASALPRRGGVRFPTAAASTSVTRRTHLDILQILERRVPNGAETLRHPGATCSAVVALTLARLEQEFGRQPATRAEDMR